MPTVYVEQFLFGVQREFGRGLLLDTSYVYTHGKNLNFATDINQATTPSSTAVGGFECTSFYHCGNPNPVFNSIAAQILHWIFELQRAAIAPAEKNVVWLELPAQLRLVEIARHRHRKRSRIGHRHLPERLYSRALNYGLSDFNAANTLVGQIVYELPFGHGRQFALHGPLDQIAGGWRVSSLFQWHGGVPYTPVIQSSVAGGIDPGLTPAFNAGSTLYPRADRRPKSVESFPHDVVQPRCFRQPGLWDLWQHSPQYSDRTGFHQRRSQHRKGSSQFTRR